MGASVWLQVFVGVAVMVIGTVIIIILKRFIAEWRESNANRKLHHIKTDCIIAGLKRMNGNTSLKFEEVFDSEFKSRTEELDFINKESRH